MAVKLWQILVPVSIVTVIIIILLAVLIPRPVPCDDHFPRIDYIAQTGFDRSNASLIKEAKNVVCFPRSSAGVDTVNLYWKGEFLTSTPETEPRPASNPPSGSNPPIFVVEGTPVTWDNIEQLDCTDLEVWMRPGVLSCTAENMTIANRNITSPVVAIPMKVVHDTPCYGDTAETTVTAVSEELINLQADATDPPLLCINSGPYTGQGFLFVNDGENYYVPEVVYGGERAIENTTYPLLTSCTNISISEYPEILRCSNFTVDIPNQPAANPFADLQVTNSFPCSDVAEVTDAFAYTRGTVQVFASAPDVLYNQISIQVSLYVSGLSASNTIRKIIFENNVDGSSLEYVAGITTNPSFNQVSVVVNADDLSAGSYDVVIEASNDPAGCSGRLQDGLIVVDQTSLTILSTDPQYAWEEDFLTPITITAGGNLIDTPSVYISDPVTGISQSLPAVQWINPTTLTAVVQNDMIGSPLAPRFRAGLYDIVVINPSPDNRVGVLEGFYTITTDPLPRVDTLSVSSFVSGDAALNNVVISGANFFNASVVLDCIYSDPNNAGATSTQAAGDVTVVDTQPTAITVNIPFVRERTFCTLTVTNQDGAFFVYSGVNFKPSNRQPILPIEQLATLNTARRMNAIAAGSVTSAVNRFYVMGGDTQNVANYVGTVPALDTVESSRVNNFGQLSNFTVEEARLPTACTYSDAVNVGRYIYLMCGHNGTSPVTTVYRSEVLSPLAAPRIDLSITFVESNDTGIFANGGSWQYRVSAVFDVNDEFNPDGESLPGEPLSVKLPQVEEGEFLLTLSWPSVAGAIGYNVYRTKLNPSRVSDIGLLATVTSPSFEDDGKGAFLDANNSPKVAGILGNWATVKSLNSARAWGDLQVAPSPSTPGVYILFAFGGNDGSGVLDSYEFSIVTVTPQNGLARETQVMGDWTVGANNIVLARMGLSSDSFPRALFSNIAGLTETPHLLLGPGVTPTGDADAAAWAEVTADGELTFVPILKDSGSGAALGLTGFSGYCIGAFSANAPSVVIYGEKSAIISIQPEASACSGLTCIDRTASNIPPLNNDNLPLRAMDCSKSASGAFLLFAGNFDPDTSAVTDKTYSIWY